MKKRIFSILLTAMLVLSIACFFVGCGGDKDKDKASASATASTPASAPASTPASAPASATAPASVPASAPASVEHVHTYADAWTTTATEHWHAATCEHGDLKSELGNHVYDNDDDFTCNVCGYERVPLANSIDFDIQERTYTRMAQGLVLDTDFTVGHGTPTVYYKVQGTDDTEYTTEAPIDAGNYTSKVVVEGNAIYAGATATQNFTIAQKSLVNPLYISREFNNSVTATGALTAGEGVCAGDTVNLTVTTNADYGICAYVGNDKEVVTAVIDNDNYVLPVAPEIHFSITPLQLQMNTNTLRNRDTFLNYIYQGGTNIPSLDFGFTIIGESSRGWTTQETIYLWDGTMAYNELTGEIEYGGIGDAVTEAYALEHQHRYLIEQVVTPKENSNYLGGSYKVGFTVHRTEQITSADTISVIAGQTKTYLVTMANANHIYNVGSHLGGAEVTMYRRDTYGLYRNEIDRFFGDSSAFVGTDKILVKVTADTAIESQLIFDDVSYTGAYDDQYTAEGAQYTFTLPASGTAGKWLKFRVSCEDLSYTITYTLNGAVVYYIDDLAPIPAGQAANECPSGTVAGSEDVQDGDFIIYVFSSVDLGTPATITVTRVD